MGLGQPVPISGAIQKAYRDTLLISEAPSYLDPTLPIQPVAVIATSAGGSSVSVSDGTDTLEINSDGSINVVTGIPNSIINVSDQTSRSYTNATEVTALSYTVTTGKTLYITDIGCSEQDANQLRMTFSLYNGSTLLAGGLVSQLGNAGASVDAQSNASMNFRTPLKVASGVTVTIKVFNVSATTTAILNTFLSGFEL